MCGLVLVSVFSFWAKRLDWTRLSSTRWGWAGVCPTYVWIGTAWLVTPSVGPAFYGYELGGRRVWQYTWVQGGCSPICRETQLPVKRLKGSWISTARRLASGVRIRTYSRCRTLRLFRLGSSNINDISATTRCQAPPQRGSPVSEEHHARTPGGMVVM